MSNARTRRALVRRAVSLSDRAQLRAVLRAMPAGRVLVLPKCAGVTVVVVGARSGGRTHMSERLGLAIIGTRPPVGLPDRTQLSDLWREVVDTWMRRTFAWSEPTVGSRATAEVHRIVAEGRRR